MVIIAACLASYFNALFADFVWDDVLFIVNNPYMKSFRFLPKFFIQDFWSIYIKTINVKYYRPLLAASFMLDYALWGNNPFGYHLTNVIFHILASILVFLFVQLLVEKRFIAFVSALLFSVHPVHTEVVSFISGRVDSVPLVFYLLSLILFLIYSSHKRIIFYLLSLACFGVSLLTKEMAVTLPLIAICIDYFFLSACNLRETIKKIPKLHFGFFVILGLYLMMRRYAMGVFCLAVTNKINSFIFGTATLWRIFTAVKISFKYIKLLFWPYSLNVEYLFPPANSLFEPEVLSGVILICLLLYIAIKNSKRQPILSFSILWFFITILPVSNIIPQGNIFAERYTYTPSLGFCIAVAFLFSRLLQKDIKTHLFNWKKSIYVIICLLIVAQGRVTYERNKAWDNDFTLWYDAVKKSPQVPRVHLNLGRAYYKFNNMDSAMLEAKIALELYPSYSDAYFFIGKIYLKSGQIDKAIEIFEELLKFQPSMAVMAYNGLSIAYGINGDLDKAIEAGENSLKIDSEFRDTLSNLAINYERAGFVDKAIDMYNNYLKLDPYNAKINFDIGQLYSKKGDCHNAKKYWLRAIEIDGSFQLAKDALGLLKN